MTNEIPTYYQEIPVEGKSKRFPLIQIDNKHFQLQTSTSYTELGNALFTYATENIGLTQRSYKQYLDERAFSDNPRTTYNHNKNYISKSKSPYIRKTREKDIDLSPIIKPFKDITQTSDADLSASFCSKPNPLYAEAIEKELSSKIKLLKDKSNEILSKSFEKTTEKSSKLDKLDKSNKLEESDATNSKNDLKEILKPITKEENFLEFKNNKKNSDKESQSPPQTVRTDKEQRNSSNKADNKNVSRRPKFDLNLKNTAPTPKDISFSQTSIEKVSSHMFENDNRSQSKDEFFGSCPCTPEKYRNITKSSSNFQNENTENESDYLLVSTKVERIINREISLEKLFDVKNEINSAKRENFLIKQKIDELSSGRKNKSQTNFFKSSKIPVLGTLEKQNNNQFATEKKDSGSPAKPYTFRDITKTDEIELEETQRKTDRPRYGSYSRSSSYSYNPSRKLHNPESSNLSIKNDTKNETKNITKIDEVEEKTSSMFDSIPKELAKKSIKDTPYIFNPEKQDVQSDNDIIQNAIKNTTSPQLNLRPVRSESYNESNPSSLREGIQDSSTDIVPNSFRQGKHVSSNNNEIENGPTSLRERLDRLKRDITNLDCLKSRSVSKDIFCFLKNFQKCCVNIWIIEFEHFANIFMKIFKHF